MFSSQGIASIAGRVLTTLLIRCGKVHIAAVMLSCYAIAQGSMFAGIFCNKFSEASQISLVRQDFFRHLLIEDEAYLQSCSAICALIAIVDLTESHSHLS